MQELTAYNAGDDDGDGDLDCDYYFHGIVITGTSTNAKVAKFKVYYHCYYNCESLLLLLVYRTYTYYLF